MRRRPAVQAAALAVFFGALVLMSLVVDDGNKNPAAPAIGGRRMVPGAGGHRGTALRDVIKADEDPFQASERRVPNGPDPIHNRGTGKSERSPGRA